MRGATDIRAPYDHRVDVLLLTIVGAAGAAVGVMAVLALGLRVGRTPRTALEVRPPQSVPDGVEAVLSVLGSSGVLLDLRNEVLRASPSAYAFGLVRDGVVVVPELLEMARAVRRDGATRQAELEIPRGRLGHQTLVVSARVAALPEDLVLALVDDRTQSRRIDEVRRDFVANVSHELKTPVGAMALLAEAVQEASADPPAVRRFADRMQHEAARLARLVQEIIDLSRVQYDDPLEAPAEVQVDQVVAAALDRSRVDANAKGITLVSGGEPGTLVLGNQQQLVIALGNLVDNAVAYSPDRTRVAVGVRRREDVVEITVADQGVGIPEQELDRIFERFYRVDPARSRKTGGTGLGLSIVKHIAASHGGEVTVWSVQGAGSTFTLRLPLHDMSPAEGPRAPVPVPEASQ